MISRGLPHVACELTLSTILFPMLTTLMSLTRLTLFLQQRLSYPVACSFRALQFSGHAVHPRSSLYMVFEKDIGCIWKSL